MLKISIIGVLLTVSVRSIMGQGERKPYCGPRTEEIRNCRNNDECTKYSDEICAVDVCKVDPTLYQDFTCPPDGPDESGGGQNGGIVPPDNGGNNQQCYKMFGPDCDARDASQRSCETDCDCKYKDEYCGEDKYCYQNKTIYQWYECQDSGCQKYQQPDCRQVRTLELQYCKSDCDCYKYLDEYCNTTSNYCAVNQTIYDDYSCPREESGTGTASGAATATGTGNGTQEAAYNYSQYYPFWTRNCVRHYGPYCGFKLTYLVACNSDCDCPYSDERCSQDSGYCETDQSFYSNYECVEDTCQKELKSDCRRNRPYRRQVCENDCDCYLYNDQYCNADGYCEVDESFYYGNTYCDTDQPLWYERYTTVDCRWRPTGERHCYADFDCEYDDEYCSNYLCIVNMTLYTDYYCPPTNTPIGPNEWMPSYCPETTTENPCNLIDCMPGYICSDGRCIADCSRVRCSQGLRCDNGACIPRDEFQDPCANVGCATGTRCQDGDCVPDGNN